MVHQSLMGRQRGVVVVVWLATMLVICYHCLSESSSWLIARCGLVRGHTTCTYTTSNNSKMVATMPWMMQQPQCDTHQPQQWGNARRRPRGGASNSKTAAVMTTTIDHGNRAMPVNHDDGARIDNDNEAILTDNNNGATSTNNDSKTTLLTMTTTMGDHDDSSDGKPSGL
ncbi:hypothetical protein EDB89DRAFT_1903333 [Lactarius sanguifluus]|nr:hypothetical protein EDB89DRAFT_1903333 [Lactarius sanguifluus]